MSRARLLPLRLTWLPLLVVALAAVARLLRATLRVLRGVGGDGSVNTDPVLEGAIRLPLDEGALLALDAVACPTLTLTGCSLLGHALPIENIRSSEPTPEHAQGGLPAPDPVLPLRLQLRHHILCEPAVAIVADIHFWLPAEVAVLPAPHLNLGVR